MPPPRPASLKTSKFEEGEAVLCFQGILIYEAKVQSVQKEGSSFLYDIHYKGWNKTWDETVPEERLLKITPENLQKQREILLSAKKNKKKNNVYLPLPSAASLPPSITITIAPSTTPSKPTAASAATPTVPAPAAAAAIATSSSSSAQGLQKLQGLPGIQITKGQGVKRPLVDSECKIKEVRLNVRKLKKMKSRSNSESSSVSVQSNRSSEEDISTRIKKRPPRSTRLPKIMLEPDLEPDPEQIKKDAKKLLAAKKKKLASISGKAKLSNSNVSKNVNTVVARPKVNTTVFGNDIKIELSEELNNLLIDDYDLISRQRKTLTLPSRVTVVDLINSFNEDSKKTCGGRGRTSSKVSGMEDVCQGLIQYFDASLGTQLLYKFERVQYSDILKEHPGVAMSRLYGPIHVLRLLTKLGPLLTKSSLVPAALTSLHTALTQLAQYMTDRRSYFFRRDDYGTASPEYHRRAL